jgi:3-oxoacyl-[acyl-carrier protein] reductase
MVSKEARPVAVVTGAGSGIGAACAKRFAAEGFDVLVNFSRNKVGAARIVDDCKAAGADAIAVKGSVANDGDCTAIAAAAVSRWGRIDALVNCAGTTISASAADLEALTGQDFAGIFAVNVNGAYQMTRAVWPHLRQAPAASIVNVSSSGGSTGLGSSLAYAASKGALNTLTLGLARALAPHARVNAVCPGVVDTEWRLAWQTPEQYEVFKKNEAAAVPLGKITSAEDVADAIFWFTKSARTVTGQLMTIDAGMNLKLGVA